MTTKSSNVSIYQIYYNEQSRQSLDQGFIPLDNSQIEDKSWYEFSPIFNFLSSTELKDQHWYGFLSPKFTQKTGLNSENVYAIIEKIDSRHDVLLLSHAVDQIIWFDDVFAQGDCWHPGLVRDAEKFFKYANIKNIEFLLSHSKNFAFSNFVVAKRNYWEKWLTLAKKLFSYAQDTDALNNLTTHRDQKISMKVFLQERLVSLVLLEQEFRPFALPLEHYLKSYNYEARELLIAMDVLKREFTSKKRRASFNEFKDLQEKFTYEKSRGLILKSESN